MLNKISTKDFSILEKVGDGQFAKVYKAIEKNIKRVVALKKISKSKFGKTRSKNTIESEVKIHFSLKHPNLLQLFGTFTDDNATYLILEFCGCGEMRRDILKCKGYPNERAATYVYQISSALEYCHNNSIIHRDIKSENILLTSAGAVKIADFGCSKLLEKQLRHTFCGTLAFVAPEILNGAEQTAMVDIWSLGVLCYEMLFVRTPFHAENVSEIRDNIRNVRYEFPPKSDISVEYFLNSLLRKDTYERLTASQVLAFPFILKYSENTLKECKAAVDQWAMIQKIENSITNSQTSSAFSNVICPNFDFANEIQNLDVEFGEAENNDSLSFKKS